MSQAQSLDHVTRALAYSCEVCKAPPMRPCIDGPKISIPQIDGCHASRVHRGLYGKKMPPIFREYTPESPREAAHSIRAPEPKGTLEEVIARAMETWESQGRSRKPVAPSPRGWNGDD